MVSAEDRFMIKELHRAGVSISEIARRTGHDRKTIRAALTAPVLAERAPAPPRIHKLDPFVAYLEERVALGVINGRKLFAEIKDRGYTGSYTRLKDWLHPRRPARTPVATVRFETEPGEQAQVDFAHFGTITHHGREQRLWALVMTLGWSRMLFVRFGISGDWVAFLRGHLAAFTAFGGVPRTVLHDNLKSAVLAWRAGAPHFHPRYLDFADYYGFAPRACRPYRAQTKGKVERAIHYLRGNFWPGYPLTTLEALNHDVTVWLDTIANQRVHATTGVTPVSRWPQEGLASIVHLPPYPITPTVPRTVSRDGMVAFGGQTYAVPLVFAATVVLVTPHEDGSTISLTTATGSPIPLLSTPPPDGRSLAATPPPAWGAPTVPAGTAAAPHAGDFGVPDAPVVEQRPLSDYLPWEAE